MWTSCDFLHNGRILEILQKADRRCPETGARGLPAVRDESSSSEPALQAGTLKQTDILGPSDLDYRAVGIRDGEEIVWHWIGPHDEYEKLIGRM